MQETENQISQDVNIEVTEPIVTDNSGEPQINEKQEETALTDDGQSNDPSDDLILGKFKNTDELIKAYQELQKHQGENSKELGELRKSNSSVSDFANSMQKVLELKNQMQGYLDLYREKYNKPEYFGNKEFRSLYKEAFKSLGQDLDTDKFVELLEGYVGFRITNYNKNISAKSETQNITSQMSYEMNTKNTILPPKKNFDEMTDKEIDALLDRVI
ncbi:MAG: hypothetical protein MJ237_07450 [bacterium]|nr:hypothetical protein [bacterium]